MPSAANLSSELAGRCAEPQRSYEREEAGQQPGAEPTQSDPPPLLRLQTIIGNRAVARLVQRSQVQRQEKPPSAQPDPVARVNTAIAAGDVDSLKTIQRELLIELAKDPLNPPKAVRDGLATARHWTMDRIAAIRDQYAPILAGFTNPGGGTAEDHTGELETTEALMDDECTRFLDVLASGHPEYRYEHFNQTVQEKVFAAVRLHSSRRAVGQIGHRAAAEKEARDQAGLPSGAWCGAFAYAQAEAAGGLGPHLKGAMQGEGGIRSALLYLGEAARTWTWVFDHWEHLRQYHKYRGSERRYAQVTTGAPAGGIQAGDLVLIDNAFGTDPDHITTAVSFDGRFLRTVGGNQGSADPKDESGVSRSGPFDLSVNPVANDVTKWVDDPSKPGGKKKTADPTKTKNVRVHGVGRWSIVDYESRLYKSSDGMPPMPNAKELQAMSRVSAP